MAALPDNQQARTECGSVTCSLRKPGRFTQGRLGDVADAVFDAPPQARIAVRFPEKNVVSAAPVR